MQQDEEFSLECLDGDTLVLGMFCFSRTHTSLTFFHSINSVWSLEDTKIQLNSVKCYQWKLKITLDLHSSRSWLSLTVAILSFHLLRILGARGHPQTLLHFCTKWRAKSERPSWNLNCTHHLPGQCRDISFYWPRVIRRFHQLSSQRVLPPS